MKYLAAFAILLSVVATLLFSSHAQAVFNPFADTCSSNPTATVCQEANKPSDASGANSIYGPGSILAKATTLISIIIGVASVIIIIIGGIKYTLSGGDPKSTESARNTVLYALIGVAIAVVAQSIVVFVINKI